MAGKSLEYWQGRWEAIENEKMARHPGKEAPDDALNSEILLKILCEYIRVDPSCIISSPSTLLSRFFSNPHHSDSVYAAIGPYIELASTVYNVDPDGKYGHADVILARVKESLAEKEEEVGPDGDLGRILTVVEQKTGIKFSDIEKNSEILADEHRAAASARNKNKDWYPHPAYPWIPKQ